MGILDGNLKKGLKMGIKWESNGIPFTEFALRPTTGEGNVPNLDVTSPIWRIFLSLKKNATKFIFQVI